MTEPIKRYAGITVAISLGAALVVVSVVTGTVRPPLRCVRIASVFNVAGDCR